jgi:hypothetical protein
MTSLTKHHDKNQSKGYCHSEGCITGIIQEFDINQPVRLLRSHLEQKVGNTFK